MDFSIINRTLPILLKGSLMTIELTVFTIVLGSILGISVGLLKLSKNKVIYFISSLYTWMFRGTPLLLQLFFFYYGLPNLGLNLSPMNAAILGLSLNCGAYMAEIVRGGILSIDKGQFEAAKALGFNYIQTMLKIILPQTYRRLIPPIGNQFISMLKDTSLVSSIAMVELMRSAQQMYATTFKPIEIFFVTGCIYLLMTTVFTAFFSVLEKRLSIYE
ncbi:glutamine ABC transporter permease [Fervidicella metallireducens AeB]|uniref:Glutamine ABC transporter permease n=1 Tax=Fervidicella metallireducens AeB TaxID=1403537 RepID=A0A017RV11_9CLOT|nr:amino acid ABC transporter permease [Fervidicella metallireducens]EYE88446.1 glutamine ABC transporter permease [Fervidicella metallireducens AeB]